MTRPLFLLLPLSLAGCSTISSARRADWETEAAPCVTALQAAHFEEAAKLADQALKKDPENSRAHAVAAVSGLRIAAHELIGSMVSLAGSAMDATPSGVTSHLKRMKGDVDHGKDSFERKLRYLLWVN
jgi:Tfp pilus assembly protein PilF